MVRSRFRTRLHGRSVMLTAAALSVLAVGLVGCSPPVIGFVTLARHPDGTAIAVVLLCSGTATEIEFTSHLPDADAGATAEADVITWSGRITTPGITAVPLTDSGWVADDRREYRIDGHGSTGEDRIGVRDGDANLWGASQIDGTILEALRPGEVAGWDAETKQSVAVPLQEFGIGACGP